MQCSVYNIKTILPLLYSADYIVLNEKKNLALESVDSGLESEVKIEDRWKEVSFKHSISSSKA